ncbi:MAG: glycoside hydrolase family 66 protein [Sumerlaeia bacterium]
MFRSSASLLLALMAFAAQGASPPQKAQVTFLYDDRANPDPYESLFLSGNFDPDTGRYAEDWNDFRRYPMYDDGQHGDGEANDRVWGLQVALEVQSDHGYEWAVDADSASGNGWLQTAPPLWVRSAQPLSAAVHPTGEQSAQDFASVAKAFGASLEQAGKPRISNDGKSVLLTAKGGAGDVVYLAGNFNNWANNSDGRITDRRFRMKRAPSGFFYAVVPIDTGMLRYKFVRRDAEGNFEWLPDSNVTTRDKDDNTVLEISRLRHSAIAFPPSPRELALPSIASLPKPADGPRIVRALPAKTWTKPSASQDLAVEIAGATEPSAADAGPTLHLTQIVDFEELATQQISTTETSLTVALRSPSADREGPVVLRLDLMHGGDLLDRRVAVWSRLDDFADDLRYGFYANWNNLGQDYAKKSAMLAELGINAVEYYDYFPAHGDYAPSQEEYEFEPFYGNTILVEDIRRKIASGHERNIKAIAYVAAYAASESIYKKHPYPMTTDDGVPLVFNGAVMSEKQAEAQDLPKWFWLMAIAPDTPWFPLIMEEFRKTLIQNPEDHVAFDGLEIDSYGHSSDARYYSENSEWSGRLLTEVIAEFIRLVHREAHTWKDDIAISFNCVSEFGIDLMYDKTDFIFIENWAGHKPAFSEVADIAYRHRAPRHQRVILKIYPADAGYLDPPVWPLDALKLMLGACQLGGGSLMIAGEPDESTGQMHALNTLYYPDNVPMPAENAAAIARYNQFDAMLYGYHHGPDVANWDAPVQIVSGVQTRGFANQRTGTRTVTMLNLGPNIFWNESVVPAEPLADFTVALRLPDATRVESAFYGSPDRPELLIPVRVDFEQKDDVLWVRLPQLETFGALALKTSAAE